VPTPSDPAALLLQDLEENVVREWCKGRSPQTIAKLLGVSVTRVRGVLIKDARDRAVGREAVRARAAAELDLMARPLWDRVHAAGTAANRDDLTLLLKINESKRRLAGADSPVKVEVKHQVEELSDEDLAKELRRHGVEVKQLAAAEPQPPLPTPSDVEDAEYAVAAEGERSDPDGGPQLPTRITAD
jgi:hypothetical protein